MKTILVPLDGSVLAERALPYARTLATASGARVILVQIAEGEGDRTPIGRQAQAYLHSIALWLGGMGVTADTAVVNGFGQTAGMIVGEARLREADLICMATHGRSGVGRWLYGSVADAVIRQTEVPVLLVPPSAEPTLSQASTSTAQAPNRSTPRLLVTLDGSTLAEEALGPAADFARTVGADLLLLQVIEPINYALYPEAAMYIPVDPEEELRSARAYLDAVAHRPELAGLPVAVRVIVGQSVGVIAALAREQAVAAIAMATHGRRGIARFTLGSVATGVLGRAGVPLLLIRPTAVRANTAEPQPVSAARR